MALTKADMAESLFNELGLNKREARELVDMYFTRSCVHHSQLGNRSSFLVLEILTFGIKKNGLEETRKRVTGNSNQLLDAW